MLNLILVISLSAQALGSYSIWFSRYNIVAHQTVGFVIIAYVVPGLFTDFSSGYSQEVLYKYVLTSLLGAVAYLTGLQFSRLFSTNKKWINRLSFKIRDERFLKGMAGRTFKVLIFATFCLVLAYIIMGFVPMFAESPLAAKQFKGEYRDSYVNAAFLFRTGLTTAGIIMPIGLIFAFRFKKPSYTVVVLLLAALIFVSLAKGAAAAWLLLVLGVACTKNLRLCVIYVAFCIASNFAGSLFYYSIGQLFDVEAFTGPVGDASFAQLVALGASDLVDQMSLIAAFSGNGENFTYGRTFFGGLVPFSYKWNPAVWTLQQVNVGVDITEIVSGGFRLPTSLWGYVSFGWPGVVLLPFASGLVAGWCIKIAKRVISANNSATSITLSTVALAWIGLPLSGFFVLSFNIIPPLLVLAYLFHRQGGRRYKANRVRLAIRTNSA